MPAKAYGASTIVLALICIVAAAFLMVEALNPPHFEPTVAQPDQTVANEPEITPFEPFEVAPLNEYGEIIERPLFFADRRLPEETEEEPVEEAPAGDEQFTLLGVVLMPEATAALLQDDATGKVTRLKVGEQMNGWQLKSVEANRISLNKGESVLDLPLVRDRTNPPPDSRRRATTARQLARARQLAKARQLARNRSRGRSGGARSSAQRAPQPQRRQVPQATAQQTPPAGRQPMPQAQQAPPAAGQQTAAPQVQQAPPAAGQHTASPQAQQAPPAAIQQAPQPAGRQRRTR